MESEISSQTKNTDLVKIIEWIPKVWHHLNKFLETHSSSDVTIGMFNMSLLVHRDGMSRLGVFSVPYIVCIA